MNECPLQVTSLPGEPGSLTVRIGGPANISTVGAVHRQLVAAFQQADRVTIDLSGLTEIDAAGLQLFCSSHRSSLASGKGFSVTGQDRPVAREAAAALGCLRSSGCAVDTKQTCIWGGIPC